MARRLEPANASVALPAADNVELFALTDNGQDSHTETRTQTLLVAASDNIGLDDERSRDVEVRFSLICFAGTLNQTHHK